MRTMAVPGCHTSSLRAAAKERSITRPSINGPRSVMRISAECPVLTLVTRTIEPSGRVRCAAVIAFML